jgi:hypothetical protein
MPSALTPQKRAFLRRLERADAGVDSAAARNALIADGQVLQPSAAARNAAINAERARRGLLDPPLFAPTKTTHINTKPTPNGAKAIARAKQRKGTR